MNTQQNGSADRDADRHYVIVEKNEKIQKAPGVSTFCMIVMQTEKSKKSFEAE
jgi:hypothetical protein